MNNKRLSQAFLHCLWKAVEHAKSVQSCLTLSDPYRLAPLSMGFSRQEYWSGLPFPSPGDLPEPGIKLLSSCLLHYRWDSLLLSHREAQIQLCHDINPKVSASLSKPKL